MVERTQEIKKATIDFYDQFAPIYWQRHAVTVASSMEKFADLLLGPDVLDLGCGGGRDAARFRDMGGRPFCVDLSETMCESAKEKGLPTVLMDQEQLAFKPESFHGIWSRVSLLHSPPELIQKILADLRNILKPGGVLFLTMKASIGQFVETEVKTTENGSTYYCYWPPHNLLSRLDQSGFEIRDFGIVGKDFFNQRNYFEIFAVKE